MKRSLCVLFPAPLAGALLVCALLVSALLAGPSRAELFPQPPELAADLDFWVRIYTGVDTKGGLIHDDRQLGVIYEQIQLPEGASRRGRERYVNKVKERYRKILLKLARGRRGGLSREETRVLALWPEDVSNSTLKAAARRLRFQLGQADKFRAGIVRSGAWEPHIRNTFRSMDLPTELSALPHVESSYRADAYSHIGAAGLWQFTRSTGRRFLRVDHVVDERLDPFLASVAAARLLQQNRKTTGNWPLAITAYNHGAAGMRRAKRKLGTDDIAVIARKYRSRTFGFASRNFYVEFLAALEVDRNSGYYFGALLLDPPVDYDEVTTPSYIHAKPLATAFGVPPSALRAANPALRPLVWSGEKRVPKGFTLRVPRSSIVRPMSEALADISDDQRFASQTRDRSVRIRRGDTLSGIATRHRTTVGELMAINNLRSRHRIRSGQVLRLPSDGETRPAPVASAVMPSSGVYVVQSGDTVSAMATRFGISERELVRRNNLRNRNRIAVGQRLVVSDAAASAAAKFAAAAAPASTADVSPPPSTPAPSGEAAAGAATAVAALAESAEPTTAELIADPSDYSVASDGSIEIQAAETLGHIAEWLDVRASRLRHLNGLRYGQPLQVSSRLKLDFGRVSRAVFEQRRIAHHREIQEDFFAEYEIAGTDTHIVRRGDSIWLLSKRSQLPLWLLRQYNPDLDFAALHAGMRITLPRVQAHGATSKAS